MNNEIERKITSLTLMTIMVAGGMTFAIPGIVPSAHAATENLFISAEDPLFDNSFAGPMVIEVVVNDPDLRDVDEGKAEPDVTVNGQDLLMAQADDGSWYAYFAAEDMADAADAQSMVDGTSLDFGTGCTPDSAATILGPSFSDTRGVYISGPATVDDIVGEQRNRCTALVINDGPDDTADTEDDFRDDIQNVIRENKTLNDNANANGVGQINIADFPVIQLYDLTVDGTVEVKYNKGTGTQQINLVYLDDADAYSSLVLDRTAYPQDAFVHFVITDLQLNIDPTDEDSWTFGTASVPPTIHYQVFNENGDIPDERHALFPNGTSVSSKDGVSRTDIRRDLALQDTAPGIDRAALNFDDNGVLTIVPDENNIGTNVLTLVDNNDQALHDVESFADVVSFESARIEVQVTVADATRAGITELPDSVLGAGTGPVTIVETQVHSGIFKNTDEGDTSNVKITSDARRGTSATINYNNADKTVLVSNFQGNLTFDSNAVDGEWNSGEIIPVTLVDEDFNKNSLVDEDLDVNNPANTVIPAIRIGNPITLSGVVAMLDNVALSSGNFGGVIEAPVDSFSDIARLTIPPGIGVTQSDNLIINLDLGMSISELAEFLENNNPGDEALFQFLNYDLRSLRSIQTADSAQIVLNLGAAGDADIIELVAATNARQGLMDITDMDDDPATSSTAELSTLDSNANVVFQIIVMDAERDIGNTVLPIALDIFRFGQSGDGELPGDRFNDAIYRLELQESGDNTSTFAGTVEYVMLNQLNIRDDETYTTGIDPITYEPEIIVHQDLTDEDSVRVNYLDTGADGVPTQISAQIEAPTHSGIVSFDSTSYKIADTVTVTLEDADLNTDVEKIDIFTVVNEGSIARTGDVSSVITFDDASTTANEFAYTPDSAIDQVGASGSGTNSAGESFGRLLDITFDDITWQRNAAAGCTDGITTDSAANREALNTGGLQETGFTLVETTAESGLFTGTFQVPSVFCLNGNPIESVTGKDMEVNYVDFRDASGEIIEVGDSAGIRANTGSVSLDRTVYPVPFGELDDIAGGDTGEGTPDNHSIFPIHSSGIVDDIDDAAETLGNGDLTIHVRINDPDFDISASGEDRIAEITDRRNAGQNSAGDDLAIDGPLLISVSRGADEVILGTAGGPSAGGDFITLGSNIVPPRLTAADDDGDALDPENPVTREFGPITEVAPDAGIFELDLTVRYTDGPASTQCPTTDSYVDATSDNDADRGPATVRFDTAAASEGEHYCILQGDILTVEYTDPTDASGDENTVTDSATFDLRNGVLQSDKSIYIIGSDMILTLIEPDLDLENDEAETYDLDLIEWDSDAATLSMGNRADIGGVAGDSGRFDPEPSNFRETGDSTGIFQTVIEIPEILDNDAIERGEQIELEYTDWGPSGADYVGEEDEDINLTVYTSNFGATIDLDQRVYTWTDKVFITIVAPDHNFDSDLIDEIGETDNDPIKVSTRGFDLDRYRLVETGTDTGIFTGEVILTGFLHDADGDPSTGTDGIDVSPMTSGSDGGPTDGLLQADDDDGLTVSFEFSEDETVVGTALIRWNIGEVQWLESSYAATATGVVRVLDDDMNLNPESVDNFDIDVWSESDSGGIDLTVTETNEATGIFEGTVFFTLTDESSGHRLRVAEGDTITAEYEDNTLPEPYTTSQELNIAGTAIIGTVVPPLERILATNLRVVDSFGGQISAVSVDQQVQIAVDLANSQDKAQPFTYLIQVQDSNSVTVSLDWIEADLGAGKSSSPSKSWTPDASGSYTVTAFVWEAVNNPTALSPPLSLTIDVA